MELIAAGLLVVLVALAVYLAALVTYYTATSEFFSRKQKIIIILFSWLVPILGPAVSLAAISDELPRRRRPGMPLLEYIFLAGAFSSGRGDTQERESSSEPAEGGSTPSGDDT